MVSSMSKVVLLLLVAEVAAVVVVMVSEVMEGLVDSG
jgi:hypothetical protein